MFKNTLRNGILAAALIGSSLSSANAQQDPGFPKKKPDQWAIGVHFGNVMINGDVRERIPSLGYGLDVRKSLGHVVSLRAMGYFGSAKGLDLRPTGSKLYVTNPAINGTSDPRSNYYANNKLFFYNFKTNIWDVSLQAVASLNNINFYHKKNKWDLYLFAGFGVMGYTTYVNALDANGNMYDFSKIDYGKVTPRKNSAIRKDLLAVLDNSYETKGPSFVRDNKQSKMQWCWRMGGGVERRLTDNMAIGLEHSFSRVADDMLDTRGYTLAPDGTMTRTTDFDNYSFTNFVFEYRLGGQTISRWWDDPLAPTYERVHILDESVEKITKDDDGDGVLNYLDKEPNTPKGTAVNSQGMTLDSDKDGIPDNIDVEPFSQDPTNVDEQGRGRNRLVTDPNNTPVDTNNLLDPRNPKSPYFTGGGGVDDNQYGGGEGPDNVSSSGPGGSGKVVYGKGAVCNPANLPMVHFDLNRYYIKPEFNSALHEVAMMMQQCPSMKIVVIGHTDVREGYEYNKKLSWNRAMKVVDYLEKTYKLDRSRFIVKFDGETNPMIPGLPDNWSPKYEFRQYMNRRVEFRIAKPGETGTSSPAAPNGMNAGRDY